jgi:hypothetical protein
VEFELFFVKEIGRDGKRFKEKKFQPIAAFVVALQALRFAEHLDEPPSRFLRFAVSRRVLDFGEMSPFLGSFPGFGERRRAGETRRNGVFPRHLISKPHK